MPAIAYTLISTMAHADDTVVFERMVNICYEALDEFLEEIRESKPVMCTFFYVYALRNIDCPAFFGIRTVEKEYRLMKRCLVHNHDFHVGQRGLCISNRRLSGEQVEEVCILMDTFRSTRELSVFATHNFKRLLTMADIRSIRRRRSHSDSRGIWEPEAKEAEN
ncbi:unnamed protein product [Echinostoma caproni]|uniref:ORF4 n=1 Tax=Echinostoma caproni TaxID=27848 RepID=A0A183A3V5_9TREM|nr:unnamed protein product [Echinostoma caproni]